MYMSIDELITWAKRAKACGADKVVIEEDYDGPILIAKKGSKEIFSAY